MDRKRKKKKTTGNSKTKRIQRELHDHVCKEASVLPWPRGVVLCRIFADVRWDLPAVPTDRTWVHLDGHHVVHHDGVWPLGCSRHTVLDHLPQHKEQVIPERRVSTAHPGLHN